MNNEKRKKAPPGAIPPIIQPRRRTYEHVCIFPAKPQDAPVPARPKPAEATPKPKPERTFEQRVADEVERRLKDRAGNFLVGFLIGELFGQWWDKHHRD